MLKQVSIYAENKKGTIQNITGLLAERTINILGSVINDGAEYGIIRMIVSDPESAAKALTNAGYLCKLIDVLGVEVEDQVGNLHKLLTALYDSTVNAPYICPSTANPENRLWYSILRISQRLNPVWNPKDSPCYKYFKGLSASLQAVLFHLVSR